MKRGKKLIGLGIAIILGLSLILIPVASRLSPVQAAVTWTKSGVNPVFVDGVVSGEACVIYDSDEGIYKMWYTHATTDLDKFDGLIDNILGLDLGDLIDDIKNLDFRAIADNDATNLKNIIDYLEGLTVAELETLLVGTSSIISYATSPNGIAWTPDTANNPVFEGTAGAWDKYYVGAPSVIKNSIGDYDMWYTGGKMDLAALATLLDDLSLLTAANISTILGDIVDLDIAAFISDVRAARGDAYLLDLIVDLIDVINGTDVAIGHATSPDGINWTKDVANPVLEGTAGNWDRYGVGAPCVIKIGANEYEMWYTGCEVDYGALLGLLDAENISDIETALLAGINVAIGRATSPNGIAWTPDTANNPVLEGTNDTWDNYGVATPYVIRHSSTNYDMWYTGGKIVPGTLLNFLRGTSGLETALINGTNSAIGHATSPNGIAWTPDANPVLSKGAGDAWDRYGVGAPSVIEMGNTYKMWYTGAKSYLSTFILDILDDSDLAAALSNTRIAIGYASYTVPSPPEGPTAPPPGITDVSDVVTGEGVFTEEVTAESEDGVCELSIEEGTIGLTEEGEPLSEISMVEMEEPPAPPEDSNVIGLIYDFGPDGATFDPSITLTWSYDPNDIPEGVAEENLVIAIWDEEAGEWVELEDIIVDPETNTITAKASHFSAFTILSYTRPAVFVSSGLSVTPTEVNIGGSVTISVLIANAGNLTGSYEVALKIDNVVVATKEVTLAGGASQKVTFTTSKDVAGTYSVDVSGLTGSFAVKEEVVPPVVPLVPATFAISNLFISPTEVDIGEEVTISVLIANTGELTGSYEVALKIDNVAVATKEVVLAGGASQEVTFTTSNDVAGTYSIDVSGLTGSFTVKEEVVPPVVPPEEVTEAIAWWVWLIIGLVSAVIVGSAVWMVVRRRRA
jgi:predicted GH43/DUF377 family glycosyl hydrolase